MGHVVFLAGSGYISLIRIRHHLPVFQHRERITIIIKGTTHEQRFCTLVLSGAREEQEAYSYLGAWNVGHVR